MKIWIKLLIGIAVGFIAGMLWIVNPQYLSFLQTLRPLIIQIGSVILYPLVFTSLAIAVYELKQDKQLFSVLWRSLALIAAGTLIIVLIAVFSVLLIQPDPIPLGYESSPEIAFDSLWQILGGIFPENAFTIFISSSLLAVSAFAVFLGLNLSFDRLITRPAIQILDSFSRILFHMNSFLMEVIGIGFAVLSFFIIYSLRLESRAGLFYQLFVLLTLDFVVITFMVLPAITYFLGDRTNPYKWLYGMIAPILAGFFSGNSNLGFSMMISHSKKNLGIPRKLGIVSQVLFHLFGKAGTALVSVVSLIVVAYSNSRLGFSAYDVFQIIVFGFVVSFILQAFPKNGSFAALSLLSIWYSTNLESAYLILVPVSFLLASFGTALDIVFMGFGTTVLAKQLNMLEETSLRSTV
jgi:Na+/H+-dicarboxylate symporter